MVAEGGGVLRNRVGDGRGKGGLMRYLIAWIVCFVVLMAIIKYDRWKHGPM